MLGYKIMDANAERCVRLVALEAFSGANISETLQNAFPVLVDTLTSVFNKFVPGSTAISLTSKQSDFLRNVNSHSYLDISPLTAYVPEGLSVQYLDYCKVMMPAVEHASEILNGVLSQYSVFLSQMIGNPDHRGSMNSFDHVYNDLNKERAKLNENLGDCFKVGSTKSEVNIGAVVSRNSDWHSVIESVEKMSKLVNSVDRKALNKKIAECTDLLKVIMRQIDDGSFEGASPETATNLSNGAYSVASELEFFSVMYYKTATFTEAVDRTMKHFKTVFEK
jgi:hypothetical protein